MTKIDERSRKLRRSLQTIDESSESPGEASAKTKESSRKSNDTFVIIEESSQATNDDGESFRKFDKSSRKIDIFHEVFKLREDRCQMVKSFIFYLLFLANVPSSGDDFLEVHFLVLCSNAVSSK